MNTLLLTFLLLLAPRSDAGASQTACPSEVGNARRVVTRLLTDKDYMDARIKHGFPALGVASFRVLTDAHDASVCTRMTQVVAARSSSPDWRTHFDPVYYQAGNFYLAALAPKPSTDAPPPPGYVRIRLGWTPLFILDANLNVVASVAM